MSLPKDPIKREIYLKNLRERMSRLGKSGVRKGAKLTPLQLERLRVAHLGQKAWNKGKKVPQTTGKNHFAWKVSVGYRGLHTWVERVLGKPESCEFCSTKGTGHQMHWANVSGEYMRDATDWVRLCPPCHGIFDSTKNSINNLRKGL